MVYQGFDYDSLINDAMHHEIKSQFCSIKSESLQNKKNVKYYIVYYNIIFPKSIKYIIG